MFKTSRGKKTWIQGAIVLAVIIGGFAYWYHDRVVLTHQQEVWLHALEWCESSGLPAKINKKDVDGTPSYYSFQFKPSTFQAYGIKYGIFPADVSSTTIKEKLDDYAIQKKIVSLMMDDPSINWRREFPDCVRRLGRPPIDN